MLSMQNKSEMNTHKSQESAYRESLSEDFAEHVVECNHFVDVRRLHSGTDSLSNF